MKKILSGAAVFILLGGALAAHIQRRANIDPEFCVSCHLPGGDPLHAPKMRRMRQRPPVDLAGAHDAAPRGRAWCAECHHGSDAGERAVLFMLQMKNTTKYFLTEYREPERLEYPVSDTVCGGCHAGLRSRADPDAYHGRRSHELPGKARCAGCHPAHTATAQSGPWSATILEQCGLCHHSPETHHEIRRMLGLAPLAPR